MRMSKQKKKGLVPERRFPEFRDAGEWVKKVLEPYIEQYSEKVPSNTDLDIYSSTREGLKPQSDYYDGRELANDGEYGVVPNGFFVYRHMSDDDIFKFNINKLGKKIAVSKEYPIFRTVNLVSNFLLYHLNEGREFKNFAASQKKGGTRTRLYFNTLRSFESFLPSVEEQQKIADCLTAVDELITTQTEKLDALKTHKKGLMQQLFPANGETMPKRRFPEFCAAGEWGAEELGGKTIKVGSGITPNGGDKNYKVEGRPFVRSQNVGWGCLILDDVAYIDEETHSSFLSTEIQKDDVLLNITGASIGRSAVANLQIEGGNVNQHVCIIRTKKRELNPFYLKQFLISQAGQSQIDSFQAGGNRQGLNFAQIRSFSVPMPPKIEEQQKIADCLTTVDDLIAAQVQKIEALKAHKKGLMQQLFPAMDEVSA